MKLITILFISTILAGVLLSRECTNIDYVSATQQYIIVCIDGVLKVEDMFLMDKVEFEILLDANASN